jgi:hypothetical protein
MSAHGVIRSSITSAGDREHRRRTFLRHLAEMIIAMMLGMCMLGMAFRGIHTALFGGGSTPLGVSTRSLPCSR